MGPICGATFGAVFGSIYSATSGSNLLPFFGLFTNTSVVLPKYIERLIKESK